MKKLSAVITILSCLFAFTSARAAMPSGEGRARQVLTVTQNSNDGTSAPAFSAYVSPLVNSAAGFGPNLLRTAVKFPNLIGTMPLVPVTTGMDESQVLDIAVNHFKTKGPALAAAMQAWMKCPHAPGEPGCRAGVSFAWFTYQQKLRIFYSQSSGSTPISAGSGGTYSPMMSTAVDPGTVSSGAGMAPGVEERLLVWTMSTDQDGRLLFGTPKIIPPKPKTLYVIYTPKNVDTLLPSTWAYPNAGTLFVQTRDENFVVIPGTDERIDVNGAFDEPAEIVAGGNDPAAAAAFNSNAALACLMNQKTAGCTNTVSVRGLMDARGANMAVVDYIRKVQPVYDEIPLGSGNLVARSTLDITQRLIHYTPCGQTTFTNSGMFGFQLSSRVTRYVVAPDGQYGPIGEKELTEQSPSQPYTGTVAVLGADVPKLKSYVINPLMPTSSVLLPLSTLNVQNLADLTIDGDAETTMRYARATPNTVTGFQPHVFVACDSTNNTLQVSVGWQPPGDIRPDWPNSNPYATGLLFTPGVPATKGVSTNDGMSGCGAAVAYDGFRSITLSPPFSTTCDSLVNGNYVPSYFQRTGDSGDVGYTVPGYSRYDGLRTLFPSQCPAGSTDKSVPGASGCIYDAEPAPLQTCTSGEAGSTSCTLAAKCADPTDTWMWTSFQTSTGDGGTTTVGVAGICVRQPQPIWTIGW